MLEIWDLARFRAEIIGNTVELGSWMYLKDLQFSMGRYNLTEYALPNVLNIQNMTIYVIASSL